MSGLIERAKDAISRRKGLHQALSYSFIFLVSTVSALVFAFGFNTFMAPMLSEGEAMLGNSAQIASGGMSGVSQVITAFCKILGWREIDENAAHSILYFLLNVPLMLLAFFGIGKRFAIFTLVNVIETSLFMRFISPNYIPLLEDIAQIISKEGGLLSRALFGGVCTGLSSALCFKVEISTGGIDIIAYYISLRKRTNVGKYSALCNGVSVTLFTLLEALDIVIWGIPEGTADTAGAIADPVSRLFFSILYLFASAMVVDAINVRNRKIRIEAVTSLRNLGSDLVKHNRHGVTVIEAKGAYTGQVRYIVSMVVSAYEVKSTIRAIKLLDDQAFIQTESLNQVYGRFYMKPIE